VTEMRTVLVHWSVSKGRGLIQFLDVGMANEIPAERTIASSLLDLRRQCQRQQLRLQVQPIRHRLPIQPILHKLPSLHWLLRLPSLHWLRSPLPSLTSWEMMVVHPVFSHCLCVLVTVIGMRTVLVPWFVFKGTAMNRFLDVYLEIKSTDVLTTASNLQDQLHKIQLQVLLLAQPIESKM
jgi:hypothetical protein